MNCKYCNAELGENSKFCSNCGKPVEDPETEVTTVNEVPVQEPCQGPEIAEPKKNGAGKIALVIAAVVVVLAVLIAVVVGGLGGEELFTGNDATVAPTAGAQDENAEATEGTIPADTGLDDVTCKGSYTAADETLQAAVDTVVATMGDQELTVGQLQIYYWTEFVYFMQNYGTYASYFGLDYTQPLDTQLCSLTEEPMTWQQYFLFSALDSWKSHQSMALEAAANGMELGEARKTELENMPADLEAAAVSYGMADAAELMLVNYGAGASVESYVHYWDLYYAGEMFYNDQYEKALPTAEEVEAYFAENEAVYAENGITKDAGKYVDVRHILIMPEGGTYDEAAGTTTYSDEEWAAAEEKAQDILDQWLAGEATEESFAALANEHSFDSDGTDGGLYENVYVGQMVENFENWCFDEVRQVGDYGMVQTEYGYHIMFFSGSRDIWFYTAEVDLTNERTSNLIPAAIEKYPVEIDYNAILLGLVELN